MPRGRRPVIQLKSTIGNSSYLARYGCYSNSGDASNQNKDGNVVKNLVGDYLDSDNDSGEDNEVPPLPPASVPAHIPMPPELPDIPMPPTTKSSSLADNRADPVIDDEVANFLAEIDAISTVSNEGGSKEEATPPPSDGKEMVLDQVPLIEEEEKQPSYPKCEIDTLSDKMEVDSPQRVEKDTKYKSMFVKGQSEFGGKDKTESSDTNSSSHSKYKSMFVKGKSEFVQKVEKMDVVEKTSNSTAKHSDDELPEEPVSLWQQCLDEHTQFSYYWHTLTNEVTWEIPPEYTQYLLLFKEYEEHMARIPPEKRARLKEKKLKSEVKVVKQHPAEEHNGTAVSKQSDRKDVPGAHDTRTSEHSDASKAKSKTKSHNSEVHKNVDTKHASKTSSSEKVKSEKTESKVDSNSEHKSPKSSKHKHKSKSKDRESRHAKKDKAVSEKDVGKSTAKPVVVSAAADEDVDVDFDIDDIDRALELALERKKAELQRLEDEETTPATQGKEISLKRSSSPEQNDSSRAASQAAAPSSPKRKKLVAYGADEDDSEDEAEIPQKETTIEKDPPSTSVEKLPVVSSLIKIKEEVEDQANIALGKLEFLEVTKKGLSRLQVLLLELQTRFRDWQDDGLSTEYFLQRLAEANNQLEQYEQSAVPRGWSCHWDRNFRRYFYTNMITGESRWDYPDIEATAPPPPLPPDVVDEQSDETSQPVSSSSVNKPAMDEEETSVSVPLAEVSTTTYDSHKIPDTSCKSEEIFEGPQLPDSIAMVTEDVTDSTEPTSLNTLDVPVHPGEPPPPGFDPPQETTSAKTPAETESSTATVEASGSIDGVPYSPNSSNGDVKEDDFDVDKLLEDTAMSMATDSQQASAVIYQPPKTNVLLSSSVTTVQPPVSYQPPLAYQPPVEPSISATHSPVNSPAPDDEPSSSTQDEERRDRKEKKKKKEKEKKISSTSLTYKKKNVSSLVQKWHQVKVQVEQEEKLNEERQMAIRQKLEEWKQTHS